MCLFVRMCVFRGPGTGTITISPPPHLHTSYTSTLSAHSYTHRYDFINEVYLITFELGAKSRWHCVQ